MLNTRTIEGIEEAMAEIIMQPLYPKVIEQFERMLKIMGNVDGNEIVALVLLAHMLVIKGMVNRGDNNEH